MLRSHSSYQVPLWLPGPRNCRFSEKQTYSSRRRCKEIGLQRPSSYTDIVTLTYTLRGGSPLCLPASDTDWPKLSQSNDRRLGLTTSTDPAYCVKRPREDRAERQYGICDWARAQVGETMGSERASARSEEQFVYSEGERCKRRAHTSDGT